MATAYSTADGQSIRDQENARRQVKIASVQDIGDLPPIKDPARRAAAVASLRVFCESYFPSLFRLKWSDNHLRAIDKLEAAIKFGDLFALAMPRGNGKTSILRAASLWAVLGGWRKFVVYIAANAGKASEAIDTVKRFVWLNPFLHEDFGPELLGFRKLENQSRRCDGQKCGDQPTNIEWGQSEIAFPTVPGGACNGSRIAAFGIESGDILGTQRPLSDGQSVLRPDFVIIDDPQTNESAKSPSQTADRCNVIGADVLGMAGPDVRISAALLCTVKQQNDLASRFLDRKQSPEWRGECMALMDAMPTRMDLWDKYAEIKHDCERRDVPTTEATEFLLANWDAMHEGAKPTWPERFDPMQKSAVQYAMDLYYRDQRAFRSEYQNDPMERETAATMRLTPAEICERVNRIDRGVPPVEAATLTVFIDVQQSSLWWVACWFDRHFAGGLLDYGTFPDQSRLYFSLHDVESGAATLAHKYPHAGLDGQLYAGLGALTEALLGRDWTRADGTPMKVDRCLIDANWGRSTKIVKKFCRESKHAATLTPSHGRYVGATSTPFDQYPDKPGERVGDGWRMPRPASAGEVRHIAWDTNYWKSFFHARISTAQGDPGSFTLFGKNPSAHRMFADHCAAEYSVRVTAKGRTVDEWKERPEKPDNHWFDGVVGCMVAASVCGCVLPNAGGAVKKPVRTFLPVAQEESRVRPLRIRR